MNAKKSQSKFPLCLHPTGRWCKKVRGRLVYFGRDRDEALRRWTEQRDDLLAGREPRPKEFYEGLTVRSLCNQFLTHKQSMRDNGELTPQSFALYFRTCRDLLAALGRERRVDDLMAADFAALRTQYAKRLAAVALGNEIARVRSIFKFGYDSALIDKPVRYGPGFSRPSAKTIREVRAKRGLRMFERDELLACLEVADPIMRAMILLGINGGLGNGDLSSLPIDAFDMNSGWLNYPRPKTAIGRRIPLWRETVEAVKAAIAQRPTPREESLKSRVFIRPQGGPFEGYRVTTDMDAVLKAAVLERPGLSFYALRHTFETIGGESRDQVAVDSIMGHAADSRDMAAVYRERISDDRLRAVVDHVHKWLWPTPASKSGSGREAKQV